MIEQVIIKNYKSIRDLELELNKINIFIGSNGVGKTNFISFFELVSKLYYQRLGSYTLEKGGIDNILYFGRKNSKNLYGLLDFDNNNAFFFNIIPSQSNKGFIDYSGDYFNSYKVTNKNYEDWNKKYWDRSVEESHLINHNEYRANYLKNYLRSFIVYHFHDTSNTSPMKQFCNIADNNILKTNGSNLAAYLYFIKLKHPKVFNKIEAVIRSIAPYFERFDLKPDRNNEQQIKLEWVENGSDMYMDGHSFSDGTLRFIALTTLLLQPEPPKVIIIDEPELGLHPLAINIIAQMIKSASEESQIIVSTQSTNFVNNFEVEDIVVVDRLYNQSVFKHLNKEELNAWLEDYTLGDIWEKNIIGGQP